MKQKDYYELLGIKKGSGAEEIRKAYRRLARKYHPDVNPNNRSAEDRFKAVSEAYDVLGDAKKRKVYDQYGFYSEQIPPGGPGAGPGSGSGFPGFDFSGFDFTGFGGCGKQLQRKIYGGRRRRSVPPNRFFFSRHLFPNLLGRRGPRRSSESSPSGPRSRAFAACRFSGCDSRNEGADSGGARGDMPELLGQRKRAGRPGGLSRMRRRGKYTSRGRCATI